MSYDLNTNVSLDTWKSIKFLIPLFKLFFNYLMHFAIEKDIIWGDAN